MNNFYQVSLYPTGIRITDLLNKILQILHLLVSTLLHSALLKLIARINSLLSGQKAPSNTMAKRLSCRHCHYLQRTVHCPREKLQTTEWCCFATPNNDALESLVQCIHWIVHVYFIVNKKDFALTIGKCRNIEESSDLQKEYVIISPLRRGYLTTSVDSNRWELGNQVEISPTPREDEAPFSTEKIKRSLSLKDI